MESRKENSGILINLSNEEARVLLDWVTRFNEDENIFQDQAEERILFDLESILEEKIAQTFSDDYSAVLQKAREKVRD
ncbi:MAG: hypothetical protein AAF600_12435 [Bacteroidota bacterium]